MDLNLDDKELTHEEGVSDKKLVRCISDMIYDMSTRLITELTALSPTKKFLTDGLIVNGRIYKPIAVLEEIRLLSTLKHLEGVDLKSMSDEKVDPESNELIDRLHAIMSLDEPCLRVQLLKDDFPISKYEVRHLLINLNHTCELAAELIKDEMFPMLIKDEMFPMLKYKMLLIGLNQVHELATELIGDGHPSHTLKKNVQVIVEQPTPLPPTDSKKVEDVSGFLHNHNEYKVRKERPKTQIMEGLSNIHKLKFEEKLRKTKLKAQMQKLKYEEEQLELEAKMQKLKFEGRIGRSKKCDLN